MAAARGCIWTVVLLAFMRYVCAQPAWDKFNNAVQAAAVNEISESTIDINRAGKLQELAEAIERVKRILRTDEGGHGPISDWAGVRFTVVAWKSGIPTDLQGVFYAVGGKHPVPRYPQGTVLTRSVQESALITEGCYISYVSRMLHVDHPLGWPCPTGASLFTQATMQPGARVDCLIMYTYRSKWVSLKGMKNLFEGALATCQQAEPRLMTPPKWGTSANLTRMVECFHRESNMRAESKGHIKNFTGIVFVPAAEALRNHRPKHQMPSEFVGIAASGGEAFVRQVPVALPWDLNEPPQPGVADAASIYVIALGPQPLPEQP